MTATAAPKTTEPTKSITLTLRDGGSRRVRVDQIASVSFGGEADTGGVNFLGYDWDYWCHVELKSGKVLDISKDRAERLVEQLREQRKLTWRDTYDGDYSYSQKHFSPDVVTASTVRRFLVGSRWHDFHWNDEHYAKVVRETYAGRRPKVIEIPTSEGTLICNPDVFEGYDGFTEGGFGRVLVGGERFTTNIPALTSRVKVAAQEDFSAAWAKAGLPKLPTRPAVAGVSGSGK